MKKLILGMVFVFATGTIMNANTATKKIEQQESCFERAKRISTTLAIQLNLSVPQEHIAFGIEYDECMSTQDDSFFFPG